MCGFVILLLLLSRNNGNCNCSCNCSTGWNPGDYARGNRCGCEVDYGRMEVNDRRNNDSCDCGCNACEEKCACDSPVTGREDIWTSYKNPSSGRQNK